MKPASAPEGSGGRPLALPKFQPVKLLFHHPFYDAAGAILGQVSRSERIDARFLKRTVNIVDRNCGSDAAAFDRVTVMRPVFPASI
ncbi:hypothetical protein [Bradyrhizobium genosp. P]|uniref:hypothetical protein n=1 Tax=Bradyrhizobium genosp. P TaxID=83641 RepID=UPI003CF6AE57